MSQDIVRYIEIVGQDRIKKDLKENLKTELTKAIATENWLLVKEITELLEKIGNDNDSEVELNLIKYVTIIGVHKFNSALKENLISAIESEQWMLVKEISEILDNCLDLDGDREAQTTDVKNPLTVILKKSIEEEDWYLAGKIINIIKDNYPSRSASVVKNQDTKIQFKKALSELIEAHKYDLTHEIVTVIQENLVGYIREVEVLKEETKALEEAHQLCAVEVYQPADVIVESEYNLEASNDVLETMEDLHHVLVAYLDE